MARVRDGKGGLVGTWDSMVGGSIIYDPWNVYQYIHLIQRALEQMNITGFPYEKAQAVPRNRN